jgi:hypothetical protein
MSHHGPLLVTGGRDIDTFAALKKSIRAAPNDLIE